MSAPVTAAAVEVGTELPAQTFRVTRLHLVKYCGASGDYNTIHWDERTAKSVGLPDVIAHGMFTMATAARMVTDWVGDPGAVLEYGVRFSAMVVVPPGAEGTTVEVSGVVEDKREDGTVVVGLTARCGTDKVLSQARAVVRLP